MVAVLWPLLIGSATWATTVSARAATPIPNGGEHPVTPESEFIDVTCTPVEKHGKVRCISSTFLPNQNVGYYGDSRRGVTCRVALHLPNVMLMDECQELADKPNLVRCTATIPRHLKHVTFCAMIGDYLAVKPQFASSNLCKGVCATYSKGVGCVTEEGCRLCYEDLKTYFPGHDPSICEMGFPVYVPL